MILYLFGGAETDLGQAPLLIDLINQTLEEIKPKQLLHVPYARMTVAPAEKYIWGEGWVSRHLHLDSVELLDARSKADVARANNPVVFMNGGSQRDVLYEKIEADKTLKHLVMHAPVVIGESAGAAVCGHYRRTYQDDHMAIKPGLGLLPDTIIIAHYFHRLRQQELQEALVLSKAGIGIGIDSLSGIRVDTADYPQVITPIGHQKIDVIKQS